MILRNTFVVFSRQIRHNSKATKHCNSYFTTAILVLTSISQTCLSYMHKVQVASGVFRFKFNVLLGTPVELFIAMTLYEAGLAEAQCC